MAIQKEIIDNKGQATNYHRIIAFAPVFLEGQEVLNVNLASYTSEQYRQQEKETKDGMQVASTAVILPLVEDDTYSRASIYEAIMALPEWADSVKV